MLRVLDRLKQQIEEREGGGGGEEGREGGREGGRDIWNLAYFSDTSLSQDPPSIL